MRPGNTEYGFLPAPKPIDPQREEAGGDEYLAGEGLCLTVDTFSVWLDGGAGNDAGQSGLTVSVNGVRLTRPYISNTDPSITYVKTITLCGNGYFPYWSACPSQALLNKGCFDGAIYGSLVTCVHSHTFSITMTGNDDGRIVDWSDA